MIAYLSRDHAGKQWNLDDRGASFAGNVEAMLTPIYMLAMERRLLALGHDVMWLCDGSYSERHARCVQYAKTDTASSVYLACHLNAGAGDYGAAFYDGRSSMGLAAATQVVLALDEACPELGRVRVVKSKSTDWTNHAYNTISGVYVGRPCALCLEPCFIDAPDHADLLTTRGLDRMGTAIADGLHAWATP